jgi:hypothetical protein
MEGVSQVGVPYLLVPERLRSRQGHEEVRVFYGRYGVEFGRSSSNYYDIEIIKWDWSKVDWPRDEGVNIDVCDRSTKEVIGAVAYIDLPDPKRERYYCVRIPDNVLVRPQELFDYK